MRSATSEAHSFQAGAVEPEHFVVRAGLQCAGRFRVGGIALPDADVIELEDDRIVTVGECDIDSAAVAIDVAFEIDAGRPGDPILRRDIGIVRVLDRRCMAAIAAGIEIAGAVAKSDAEPECVLESWKVRIFLGADQELHRADLLQRMLRQVLGIVMARETGIGFRVRNAAGEHALGEIGVEFLIIGQGLGRR